MATAASKTAPASPSDQVLSSPERSNFCEHIFRALLKDIHREVLVWPVPGAEPLTFTSTTVMNRVSAIREELQARQVVPGHSVLLALPIQFDLVCTFIAVMAEGAIPVLPPAKASPRVLISIMRRQNVRTLVTEGKVKALFSGLLKWLGVHHLQTDGIRHSSPKWQAPQAVSPEQPGFVSHFSGPTGRVMAICRSHRVLQAQLQARKEVRTPWPAQGAFPLFPHRLLYNLATGTTSVLPDLPSPSLA